MLVPTTLRSSSAVGGQARDQFAAAGAVVEAGVEADQVRVELLAQVGDDAFAQQRDEDRSAPRWPAPAPPPRRTGAGTRGRSLRCRCAKPWSIICRTATGRLRVARRGDRQRQQPGDEQAACAGARTATARAGCRGGAWAWWRSRCGVGFAVVGVGGVDGMEVIRHPIRRSAPGYGWRRAGGFSRRRAGRLGRRRCRRTPLRRRSSRSFLGGPCAASAACTLPRSSNAACRHDLAHRDQRPAFGAAQAFGGRAAIGADQSARAQLDAAIPAGDHDHDLVDSPGRRSRPGSAGRRCRQVRRRRWNGIRRRCGRPSSCGWRRDRRPGQGMPAPRPATSTGAAWARKRLCLTSSACVAAIASVSAHLSSRARRSSGSGSFG